ncbi:DNA-binding response regulator [Psychromonas marina]|uniref:DNA-binding response regulator n=1 Tax=Psychromonas marina TaxID=88364 RepID=A0ABQ6E3P6_9GAMM|nr:response regulator transcription factor [Psychromonas marina]GLS91835.1 DNA-binding response regulator [Psychromonas marina]
MKKIKVLLLEDDLFIARVVIRRLESENYFVRHSSDIGSMFLNVNKFKFDAIILDMSLPSGDILDSIERLKKIDKFKLLIFTAKEDVKAELRGVKLGIDDYVLKSRGVDILVERLKILLFKSDRAPSPPPPIHGLVVSSKDKSIMYEGALIDMTRNELVIFYVLYRDFNVLITRDELANACYGIEYDGYSRSIDLIISRLRKKINTKMHGCLDIKSVRGGGYKLIVNTLTAV